MGYLYLIMFNYIIGSIVWCTSLGLPDFLLEIAEPELKTRVRSSPSLYYPFLLAFLVVFPFFPFLPFLLMVIVLV